ncbi:MAG: glycosyltransferase family 2 protein [Pseudomonadota bacterium]|nr:glycosyltransferase family 2 protein [Pseudomonadota bacterium]
MMHRTSHPLLSIVVPMYNESGGVDMLFERLARALYPITEDWEIVCVNDGSRDDTLLRLKAWHQKEPRIKLLSLSRNFGKEAALTAGLHYASGDAVIPFDAVLQDPPELIPQMVARWKEGYKVVLATRKRRLGEGWFKRLTAWLFYKLMRRVTSIDIPRNTGDFRLMDRQVVEVLRLLPERTRFMKGLFAWVGFTTTSIYFDRAPRAEGHAKQNYARLWQLAKDGVFSFTTLPLRLTTYLGVVVSTLAFAYAGWLLIRTLIFGVDVRGYASIMATVLCLGGVQLVSIGIIGEYLGRIYRETKQRPLYVIEESAGISVGK